jgi:hypothetical protein
VFFSNFAFDIHGFESDRVVGDDRDSVPDVLRSLFLVEGDTASVLATQHGVHCKLEFLLTSRRDSEFFSALAVQKISLNSEVYWFFLVGVFDNQLFFDKLLSFAFDLYMFLGDRFFSVACDLILEVV